MKKSEVVTLKKSEVIELNNGIAHISNLNKETGFPVYDLGYEVHTSLARTHKKLGPFMEKLAEEQREESEAHREIRKRQDEATAGLSGSAKEAKEEEFKPEFDEWREKQKARLAEPLEVAIYKFKWADVKYKGITPPPDVIGCLDPMIIWPEEK